jgi:protease-4
MIPPPPPGQGPIDPRGAFAPPPPGNTPQMPPRHPPPMMPPTMYYPPPPRQSWARTVFFTLASSVFAMSLALNVYLLIAVGLTGTDAGTSSSVVVEGDPSQTVAVVSIDGVLDGATYEQFDKVMRDVEDDSSVKALVVELDTPGGEVTASDQIYQRLLKYKTDRKVKVVASMGGMATSGGYYVACAADHILAQPTTLTGNIGVVLQRFNVSGLMDKHGVKDTSITPDDAKFKNVESPFRPESPEAAPYLRGIAQDIYARFQTIVSTSRGAQLKAHNATIEQVTDGKAYTASDAAALGLVDQIGYPPDAYARAAQLAGLTKQHVVRYQRTPSFLDALRGSSVTPDISLRVDSHLIHELTTPRLMYLYRGN